MKVVLCYSGGLDSTVLLYKLLKEGNEIKCLSVHYGQRHVKELMMAYKVVNSLRERGVSYQEVDLAREKNILKGSSQTSDDIPVPYGHYTDESMKKTVVPNRNMILLSLAGAYAISSDCEAVAYACHAGDHAIYPDCRPEFTNMMRSALAICHFRPIVLMTPFIEMSKAQIVKEGYRLNVPFNLTWSCYEGKEYHCGKCGTCQERREAFKLAGVKDPTPYGPDGGVRS